MKHKFHFESFSVQFCNIKKTLKWKRRRKRGTCVWMAKSMDSVQLVPIKVYTSWKRRERKKEIEKNSNMWTWTSGDCKVRESNLISRNDDAGAESVGQMRRCEFWIFIKFTIIRRIIYLSVRCKKINEEHGKMFDETELSVITDWWLIGVFHLFFRFIRITRFSWNKLRFDGIPLQDASLRRFKIRREITFHGRLVRQPNAAGNAWLIQLINNAFTDTLGDALKLQLKLFPCAARRLRSHKHVSLIFSAVWPSECNCCCS